VQWAMVVWGGLCCLAFQAVTGPVKPLLPLAVIVPQMAWLIYVTQSAKRAGITRW
jgi:hypothetical protein